DGGAVYLDGQHIAAAFGDGIRLPTAAYPGQPHLRKLLQSVYAGAIWPLYHQYGSRHLLHRRRSGDYLLDGSLWFCAAALYGARYCLCAVPGNDDDPLPDYADSHFSDRVWPGLD